VACEEHSAAVELLREQDTVLLQLQQGPFEVGGRWQVVKEGSEKDHHHQEAACHAQQSSGSNMSHTAGMVLQCLRAIKVLQSQRTGRPLCPTT
jgi:hypothetical protein